MPEIAQPSVFYEIFSEQF